MNETPRGLPRHAMAGSRALRRLGASALLLLGLGGAWAQSADVPTKFSNQGTIGNTRHNLTQRQTAGGGPNGVFMDFTRNNYGEVCVYCHTPHGANTTVSAPLWNRTMRVTTYQTYNLLGTTSLTQTVSQPGAASLTCLSCHDGQVAVDSIINMPGSGRYNSAANAMTEQSNTFLNTWNNPGGNNATSHGRIGTECMGCHNPTLGGALNATDFTLFNIGTDLRNDHPVGITFPATAGPGTDFREPRREAGRWAYYDNNGNQIADKAEIRMYSDSNGNFAVECASCHDPHGVPSGGAGSVFNPTFLRVSNVGSGVCLTCHIK